jgi:hypothetical protein
VALRPADRLETVWEELGRRHTQSSRSRGAHDAAPPPVDATGPAGVPEGVVR